MNEKVINAVVAAENGEIFELDGYGAAGLSGNTPVVLTRKNTISIPYGSELMLLPDRKPLLYHLEKQCFEVVENNPYDPSERIFPVAVFNSPGFVNRYFCSYEADSSNGLLPLFSYGAVGFGRKDFRSAALLVDAEPRQDLRQMPRKKIVKGVKKMQRQFPENRLMRHLETCALQYGCPAGKNFFLKRYEAPLPTSMVCNANCLGCISLQKEDNLCACQDRIGFIPSAEEIAQVALEHIKTTPDAVVSFGQGCEGEPLTAFSVIEPAIRMIREQTDLGTINLNTNGSLPEKVEKLCEAGLDAIRVSMNSVREPCYLAYFRPKSYVFADVRKSFAAARAAGIHISINYLNCPGFTDSMDEVAALKQFVKTFQVDMIQWRNLNYDPRAYVQVMQDAAGVGDAMGMENLIRMLRQEFPELRHGYFNPAVGNVN